MRLRVITILATALLCLVPTVGWADLAPYSQDFEGLLDTTLDQPDQVELANDGWLVFVNGFGPDWSYWYSYGVFPAPNGGFGGPAFSAVIVGEGGPDQGEQQLVIFSDYNNGNHGDGSNAIIETNVFQEQMIGAADVGNTMLFEFDAKRGNIDGATANAFIKTLDPAAGYVTTNFIVADMTNIPDTWDRYMLSIDIDPSLEGQILQFGFVNWASNYAPSGIFYDNINFDAAPLSASLDIKPGSCPNPINGKSRGVLPVALLGSADFDVNAIDVDSLQLEGVAPLRSSYEDVAEPYDGGDCGCAQNGPDGFLDLTIKFRTQDIIAVIGSSHVGGLEMTLTGTLLDGTPFVGKDCVMMVGPQSRVDRSVREQRTSRRILIHVDDESSAGSVFGQRNN